MIDKFIPKFSICGNLSGLPAVTMARLLTLENIMKETIGELQGMLK